MGRVVQEKRRNRDRQSGGTYPNIKTTITSLARIFKNINSSDLKVNTQEKLFVTFIYFWFTGELARLRKQDNSAKISNYKIPDLCRIKGYQSCRKHAFRTVMHGKTSWVEYALGYPTEKGVIYLWQPVPARFNVFFQRVISKKNYDQPFLSAGEKKAFKNIIEKRWKYHGLNEREQAVGRKDNLLNYFNKCASNDNQLSAIPRFVLLHDALHHKSARFYQKKNSNQIRAEIFKAHNVYIDRLMRGIRTFDWQDKFTYTRKAKNSPHPETLYLIDSKSDSTIPDSLKKNLIVQYAYQKGESKPSSADAPIEIGSQRLAKTTDVISLFQALHHDIERPLRGESLDVFIEHFNLCTYHLALTFILCTGARPTHHISIESPRYFKNKKASIKDKGPYRELVINQYLAKQISHYQELQIELLERLPDLKEALRAQEIKVLWHLIDEHQKPSLLSAALLDDFLSKRNAPFDAYSLRHAFAQYACVSIDPPLTNSQVDRLTGHTTMGEDLGNDHIFPLHKQQIIHHLNRLTINFQLKEVCYAKSRESR